MINYKTLTKEDLKRDYMDRKGFVFQSPVKSSEKAIEHLCNTLIQYKITTEHPEFVVRLNDNTTAFVYKDSFDSPAFFQQAQIATQMGVANINLLNIFLKN